MSAGFVTEFGLGYWVRTLAEEETSNVWFFRMGTGAGQTIADVGLAAPVQDRESVANSTSTVAVADDTLVLTGTITADEDREITEVGVFRGNDDVSMLVYGDFDPIPLALGDAIVFQANITFAIVE